MKENVKYVSNCISDCCKDSNRDVKDVFLLPVSKTKSVNVIEEAIKNGFNTFGENKVQEILQKYEYFGDRVRFHMIGHLQTNKVKYIIDKVDLIHSLESISLLDKLQIEASKRNIFVNCLIEVNISREDSKYGIYEENLIEFINEISKRKNVRVFGLMTVAPYFENSEETRVYFKRMKEIFDDLKKLNYDNIDMKILSMGMSNDFKVAIEEGSNLIRLGTLIFGKRDYSKI